MKTMKKISNIKLQPWFIERKSLIDEERLFIFHHAGGGATYYMPMLKYLSERVSVYIVQLPGREYRIKEDTYDDLNLLLNDLTEELISYLDRPFVFWGHSMGAMISYELTFRLKDSYGIAPKHLFLSSICAPHLSKKNYYYNLSDRELLSKVFDLGGTDTHASKDNKLMALILPTLRKDLQLCDNYQYKSNEALNVPVTILGGDKDGAVSISDLLEWDKYFKSSFSVCLFKGNHFYFRDNFSLVADIIMKEIEKSWEE